MLRLNLNTSFRAHSILGLVIGFWLVFFLVVIAPFDTSDLSFKVRLVLLPPYGLIFAGVYLISYAVQQILYKKLAYWNIALESIIIFTTYILGVIATYAYYKTDAVNGTYSFIEFLSGVYFPILLIITTLLLFGRWFIARPKLKKKEKIIIRGDSKTDVLQVSEEDILYVTSAQNYVELHYMRNGVTHMQILRKTLKKIQEDLPHLIQVHRSYLINPSHFVHWKNSQSIVIGDKEIPVSKNYKSSLKEVL